MDRTLKEVRCTQSYATNDKSGHLRHDGGRVPVARVVARLGEVAHEPQDGDPEGEGRQLVALRLQGQKGVLQRLPGVLVRVGPCKEWNCG